MLSNIISSGSKGNAIIYHDTIMVDCGVPFKLIEPYIYQLEYVLLTHIHGDHFNASTIKKLAKLRPTLVWVVPPFLEDNIKELGIITYFMIKPNIEYLAGQFSFIAHELYHNVDNVGYSIFNTDEKGVHYDCHALFHATDTYTLEHIKAKNYDAYFIEFNYRESDIEDVILEKESKGDFAYEKDAIENHQSFEKAESWLKNNACEDSIIVKLHTSNKYL